MKILPLFGGIFYLCRVSKQPYGTIRSTKRTLRTQPVGRGFYRPDAAGAYCRARGGCICIDIGASTGGFTDCMLQNGAKKVYSVDVGYGQLAWSLRTDERVVNLERTNIRYVTEEQIPDPIDFISVDVSFISLTLVLPVAYRLLRPGAQVVCLVKPQFEAGKDKVGKKGVVREPQIHKEVIQKVAACAKELGFLRMGLDFSPIKGPEGNIEYLLFLNKPENETQESEENLAEEKLPEIISEVVAQAHQSL